MYVCNVMTQPGETDDMTAADHVEALIENAGARVCDCVIVNDQPPSKLLQAYAVEGQIPVQPDIERIRSLGLNPVRAQVISETATVRHDPEKLAQVVLSLIDRSIAQRASYMRPAQALRTTIEFTGVGRSRPDRLAYFRQPTTKWLITRMIAT